MSRKPKTIEDTLAYQMEELNKACRDWWRLFLAEFDRLVYQRIVRWFNDR